MITWLQGLFDSVSNFFQMIGNLISDIVEQILNFFGYIKSSFEFLNVAISFLPTFYIVFAVIIITVLIVYLILGRQSGGD